MSDMRRRHFLALIAGGSAAWPLVARAQQGDQKRRVGILMPYAKGDAENEALVAAFKQELAKLGWAGGRNVQFDEHWTTDNMDVVRCSMVAAREPQAAKSPGRRKLLSSVCSGTRVAPKRKMLISALCEKRSTILAMLKEKTFI